MMRRIKLLFLLLLITFYLTSQIKELNVPVKQYIKSTKWNSFWITNPDVSLNDYAVVLFRKTFKLNAKPEKFIVHVSADNRYRLYVNGEFVCFGPQFSDARHWRYETVDIAPYLIKGDNVIASEIVNWVTTDLEVSCQFVQVF